MSHEHSLIPLYRVPQGFSLMWWVQVSCREAAQMFRSGRSVLSNASAAELKAQRRLIQILRRLMEQRRTQVGMLAGLAHPQLRRALVAMHERPEEEWTLEDLASVSGMSRSVFANSFRDAVGVTPGSYLQRWRIGLAQKALLQERSLKLIALEVGYGSEAALSRAFKAQVGQSPREWRNAQVT